MAIYRRALAIKAALGTLVARITNMDRRFTNPNNVFTRLTRTMHYGTDEHFRLWVEKVRGIIYAANSTSRLSMEAYNIALDFLPVDIYVLLILPILYPLIIS